MIDLFGHLMQQTVHPLFPAVCAVAWPLAVVAFAIVKEKLA